MPRLGLSGKKLDAAARAYPETTVELPWGHLAFKVKGKTFLFMVIEPERLSLSVKLPISNGLALTLPFAEPTRYGMAKSGWVTATFAPKDDVPVELLQQWVDESYRAIAPKKVLALLDGTTQPPKKSKRSKR